MRLRNFSLPAASAAALDNVRDLLRMIVWNSENGVKLFRIPTEIFPYADHPIVGYQLNKLPEYQFIKRLLREAGEHARKHTIRLTCHPGPFTVLSSDDHRINNKSIRHLDQAAEIASTLGTSDYAINIHVGRSVSDAAAAAFAANFARLGSDARTLLTVENDDKDNCWSVESLVDKIYQHTGVPVVFDSHHWLFCRRSSLRQSAVAALRTWGNRFPKMHHSESKPGSANPRAHSNYLSTPVPVFPGHYDLMLETKCKDLALVKYIQTYGHPNGSRSPSC